jgi:hypothetical protein
MRAIRGVPVNRKVTTHPVGALGLAAAAVRLATPSVDMTMTQSQVERALGLWRTGRYVLSNARVENNFSSDNWSARTATLIKAAQNLSDKTWDLIYADVQKALRKSDVVISDEDDDDPVALLCSDITDMFGQPFEYVFSASVSRGDSELKVRSRR